MIPTTIDLSKLRQELIDVVDKFPINQREEILFDQWSLKDILAHLSGWDVFTVECIEKFKNNQELKWGKGVNEFNKDSVSLRQSWSWQKIYDEFLTVSQNVIDEYASLSAGQMTQKIWADKKFSPAKFLKIDIDHYQEHLEKIKLIISAKG